MYVCMYVCMYGLIPEYLTCWQSASLHLCILIWNISSPLELVMILKVLSREAIQLVKRFVFYRSVAETHKIL